MKKTKKISLLLSPILSVILLTACGETPTERDVYQSQDECAKDWGSELCERMNDSDERDYHQHHGVMYPVYWGPGYYNGHRSVMYQGREITPTTRNTTLKTFAVSSRSSSASRTSAASPRSVSSGGFGGKSGSTGG